MWNLTKDFATWCQSGFGPPRTLAPPCNAGVVGVQNEKTRGGLRSEGRKNEQVSQVVKVTHDRRDVRMTSYPVKGTQRFRLSARRRFVEWAQNEIAIVPDFHKRILFSDEAHFWLNGYVNKQNCRIWSEANPQVYVETPLHPEKLTVWCALWAGGILLQKR
ncbi:hypothetical protein TNCV_1997201 [Trichonephila clavipes]|uniref:Transposase n=1 Tax=Trichonephila clavipes TaxID=2585209 RepID=A0A8X6V2N3_TRICX|nr:hypothetical protein TNCV_1997201 [Trichonephila clavipes]